MLYSLHETATERDHVVLLDERGRPAGTLPKRLAHHRATPFHLAFSCHVVRPDGRVLLTRRSAAKATWPGVWTNACCGHPRLGETLRDAVERHLATELGTSARRMSLVLDDFAYRAQMEDETVEHELCPVVVAELADEPVLNPAEADDARWVEWRELHRWAAAGSGDLSPWLVEQLAHLPSPAESLLDVLDTAAGDVTALDRTIGLDAGDDDAGAAPRPARSALDVVRDGVEDELRGFLAERQRELRILDGATGPLGAAVETLVGAGGKRLRPAFVYWGWRAAGGRGDRGERAALRAGAAVELLHTFALLHDDVMDRSTSRRGQPTAHRAFAADHRALGRPGDADLFGANAAILAGDLAFVWADQLFDSIDATCDDHGAARDAFTRLRTEVVAGQYLDLLLEVDGRPPDALARTVALLKTARYTVTRPLELGAALAGGAVAALRAYGDALGLAFQMRDDILDLFGDPARTGKATMRDLAEGKRTVLLARALRLAPPPEVEHLQRSVGRTDLAPADAARCCEIIARCGALASVEARIAAERRRALDAVAAVDDRTVRAALVELVELTLDRDA